jgi:hypothetical protein
MRGSRWLYGWAYLLATGERAALALSIYGSPGCRLSGRHPDLSRISAAGHHSPS